jgi:hypothetical protein
MIASVTRTLRIAIRYLLFSLVPIASVFLLNATFSYVSQGDEIVGAVRETGSSFVGLLCVVAATLYAASASWLSVALTVCAKLRLSISNSPARGIFVNRRTEIASILPLFALVGTLLPLTRLLHFPVSPSSLFNILITLYVLISIGLGILSPKRRIRLTSALLFACRKGRPRLFITLSLLVLGLSFGMLLILSPVTAPRAVGPCGLPDLLYQRDSLV